LCFDIFARRFFFTDAIDSSSNSKLVPMINLQKIKFQSLIHNSVKE
jgi:hypothetical protein